MTLAQAVESPSRKPLRLWPGIAAALLTVAVAGFVPFLGGAAGGLLILVWWLFFSRAPWAERLGALVLMVVATFATKTLVHESLATAGQGNLFYIYALPAMTFALVVWAIATRRLGRGPRLAWLAPTIVLGGLALMAVRMDGVSNVDGVDFEWRWSPTAEERLLAELEDQPALPEPVPSRDEPAPIRDEPPVAPQTESKPSSAAPGTDAAASSVAPPAAALADGDELQPAWPGFRGPTRDGVVRGLRLATDWEKSPPVELWRRPVGPAWSSFAVGGDRVYTQEQLGEEEVVSCYDLQTGAPVWRHADAVRFWEANAGPGPRATPTLHDGRVYTFGATGILNALDADDGSMVWSRDVAADAKKTVPYWGFAGSPLVIGDTLVIGAAGKPVSYDLATGELRWIGPKGAGYSSPHLATIDGVEQILIMNGLGLVGVEPIDGKELWKYDWPGDGIVQPAVIDDGSVLIGGNGSGISDGEPGLRRVVVTGAPGEWSAERGTGAWTVEESWTSIGLKPYFSDLVVHEGHAYGFNGAILAAIDLADGARKWKGGRYGNGQLVLLADQDLLLVLSEKGELALVDASPAQFTERARFKVIDGKTWNHPAVAGDIVLVRNSEEMAAFRVSPAGG